MFTKDFRYELEKDRIAMFPPSRRGHSKMLVVNPKTREIEFFLFSDIIEFLEPEDCIIFNNTKVIKARLYGTKILKDGSLGADIEILLLNPYENNVSHKNSSLTVNSKVKYTSSNLNLTRQKSSTFNGVSSRYSFCSDKGTSISHRDVKNSCSGSLNSKIWQCMVKPAKRLKENYLVRLKEYSGKFSDVYIRIKKRLEDNTFLIEFCSDENIETILEKHGHMPLPPYIKRKDIPEDSDRYQTVYGKVPGAVAAPTAGLHFTEEIINKLLKRGVHIGYLTLHTGAGTFKPVTSERIEDHKMHYEFYVMPPETAALINDTHCRGKRVLAVGTTSVRVIETCADNKGKVYPNTGNTNLFIYPPYKPKAVDMLLTNFHLPESTLLMLVSAFTGRDFLLHAYEEAKKHEFKFYSYGDCMLIT